MYLRLEGLQAGTHLLRTDSLFIGARTSATIGGAVKVNLMRATRTSQ